MCVCYKTVNQKEQLQRCLRQLHANGWLLSVMLQLDISSIRVKTAELSSRVPLQRSLQQSLAMSNDHKIPPCASGAVRYLVPNKYSFHLRGLMAASYFPAVALDRLFLYLRAGRFPLCLLRHTAVITSIHP